MKLRMRLEERLCRMQKVSCVKKVLARGAKTKPVSPTKKCCATGDAGGGTLMQGGVRDGDVWCCVRAARELLAEVQYAGRTHRFSGALTTAVRHVCKGAHEAAPRTLRRRREAVSGARRTGKGASALRVGEACCTKFPGPNVRGGALAQQRGAGHAAESRSSAVGAREATPARTQRRGRCRRPASSRQRLN